MFAHAEENVDTHSDRVGCRRLRSESQDIFPSDFVLLVVQVEKIWVVFWKCSIGVSAERC